MMFVLCGTPLLSFFFFFHWSGLGPRHQHQPHYGFHSRQLVDRANAYRGLLDRKALLGPVMTCSFG